MMTWLRDRSSFLRAGLAASILLGVGAGLVADRHLTAGLAVAAASAATTLGLVAVRGVYRLQRRIAALGERMETLSRTANEREKRRQKRSRIRHRQQERQRQADSAALRTELVALRQLTERQLASVGSTVSAIHRGLKPARADKPMTGDDMATPAERMAAALRFDGDRPSVVLMLQSLTASQIFAGVRTAVVAAAELATKLGRPLRVAVVEPTTGTSEDAHAAIRRVLDETGHADLAGSLTLSIAESRQGGGHNADDVWVATFWTTAWALGRLVRRGVVEASHVVYLVQDWEPSFYPSGDLAARALSTYRSGFHIVVNSAPLARFVADQIGESVGELAVFAPEIDTAAVEGAAASWAPGPGDEARLLYYARPSKPRNMFNLGLQTIRLWADGLPEGIRPIVRLAGESIGGVDLGPDITVENLGKTTYEEYYRLLAATDVGLALMSSAHPGHLALELPMAGIPTVTNQFGDYRAPWVDGLRVADADPATLAEALLEATESGRDTTSHCAKPVALDLGGSLQAAMSAVAATLPVSAPKATPPSS